jgi:hypothetical protein
MFNGSSTFSKPATKSSLLSSRSATTKRDSLMAELERGEFTGLPAKETRLRDAHVQRNLTPNKLQTHNTRLQSASNALMRSLPIWHTPLSNASCSPHRPVKPSSRPNCVKRILQLRDWKEIEGGLRRERRRSARKNCRSSRREKRKRCVTPACMPLELTTVL